MALKKQDRRLRIKRRIRKKVEGTAQRPRMSVFRSNKHIYVQVIDDTTSTTLASASTEIKEIAEKAKSITKIEAAALVGSTIAKIAKEKGIETVVFDRNGYLYHGRVKSLADAARNEGLKI
jgi:large subunit ribosomal protein L18